MHSQIGMDNQKLPTIPKTWSNRCTTICWPRLIYYINKASFSSIPGRRRKRSPLGLEWFSNNNLTEDFEEQVFSNPDRKKRSTHKLERFIKNYLPKDFEQQMHHKLVASYVTCSSDSLVPCLQQLICKYESKGYKQWQPVERELSAL